MADTACFEIAARCSHDGLEVHAVVDVEALVLDSYDSVLDQLGDFVEGASTRAIFGGYQRRDRATVAIDDRRRFGLLGDSDLEFAGLIPVTGGGEGGQCH